MPASPRETPLRVSADGVSKDAVTTESQLFHVLEHQGGFLLGTPVRGGLSRAPWAARSRPWESQESPGSPPAGTPQVTPRFLPPGDPQVTPSGARSPHSIWLCSRPALPATFPWSEPWPDAHWSASARAPAGRPTELPTQAEAAHRARASFVPAGSFGIRERSDVRTRCADESPMLAAELGFSGVSGPQGQSAPPAPLHRARPGHPSRRLCLGISSPGDNAEAAGGVLRER